MRTVMLMVSVWPASGFLDVPPGRGPLGGAGAAAGGGLVDRGERAEGQIGESEQKVERTFGDFGVPVLVSAPPASEVYVQRRGSARSTSASQDGGTVGFGLKSTLSPRSAG
jgi:hypothetical protein